MSTIIKPPLLKTGQTVAIVAPAGVVERSYINKAVEVFESWGLKVILGNNLFAEYHQFAGSDGQRLSDVQLALDDEEVRAVFCARGGYGTIRIIDSIHWHGFQQNPKWVVGFSDITALHATVCNQGFESVHGVMPINIGKLSTTSKPLEYLKEVLFKGAVSYSIEPHALNRSGTEKAKLIGGNLSLLNTLSGTEYDFNWDGKVLFIEDVGEQYYHIDRIMQSLRLAGKLEKLSGLIVGGFSEMIDNKRPFGRTPEEIIADIVQGFDYPVAFGFPAGHVQDNYPLIIGAEVSLEVNNLGASIKM